MQVCVMYLLLYLVSFIIGFIPQAFIHLEQGKTKNRKGGGEVERKKPNKECYYKWEEFSGAYPKKTF